MNHLYLAQMRVDANISPEDMCSYLSKASDAKIDIHSIESGVTKLSTLQYLKWFYISSTSKLRTENFVLLTSPGRIFKSNPLRLHFELILLFACIILVTYGSKFVF